LPRRFLLCSLLVCAASAAAEGPDLVPDAWALNRIWKSVEAGGKYHFYDGALGLKNPGATPLERLSALVSIFDAQGTKIQESPAIDFGTLAPGAAATRKFVIEHAIVGAETRITVSWEGAGGKGTREFSAADGKIPQPLDLDRSGTVMELRLLGYELQRPGVGAAKGNTAVLEIRVRNLAAVPARKPMAKLEFQLAKGAKKPPVRKPPAKKGAPPPPADPNVKVIEVVLSEGEIPAGGTAVFSPKIAGIPEHEGVSLTLTADWPAAATESAAATQATPAGTPVTEGDGNQLSVGAAKGAKNADGSTVLSMPVVNRGPAIDAGKLRLTLTLRDGKGTELKKLVHLCPEAFPEGATVEVKLPAQKLPAYENCDIEIEF